MAFSSSEMCRGICFTLSVPESSSIGPSVVRRRLLRLPSSITSWSESANLTRGTGHGMMCGIPTTRKDTRRVVPKREVVRRDRGWRWGVMAPRRREWKGVSTGRGGAHAVAIAMSWSSDNSQVVKQSKAKQGRRQFRMVLFPSSSCFNCCWDERLLGCIGAKTGMWQYIALVERSSNIQCALYSKIYETL